jgi:hypothetical protein
MIHHPEIDGGLYVKNIKTGEPEFWRDHLFPIGRSGKYAMSLYEATVNLIVAVPIDNRRMMRFQIEIFNVFCRRDKISRIPETSPTDMVLGVA